MMMKATTSTAMMRALAVVFLCSTLVVESASLRGQKRKLQFEIFDGVGGFDDRAGHEEPILVVVGNNGEFDKYPLGLCEGECDTDEDCEEGLYCFQRDPFEPVPGCQDVGEGFNTRGDFCVTIQEPVATDAPEEDGEDDAPDGVVATDAPEEDGEDDAPDDMVATEAPQDEDVPVVTASPTETGTMEETMSESVVEEAPVDLDEAIEAGEKPVELPFDTASPATESPEVVVPEEMPEVMPEETPAETEGPATETESPATESPATESPEEVVTPEEAPEEAPVVTESPATETESPATESPATESPEEVVEEVPEEMPEETVVTESPATETESPATESPATESPEEEEAVEELPEEVPEEIVPEAEAEATPETAAPSIMVSESGTMDVTVADSAPTLRLPETLTAPPGIMDVDELGELTVPGNNGLPVSAYPLQNCEGDCDGDEECGDGLICWQREYADEVPGCVGGLLSTTDYCVLEKYAEIDEMMQVPETATSIPGPGLDDDMTTSDSGLAGDDTVAVESETGAPSSEATISGSFEDGTIPPTIDINFF